MSSKAVKLFHFVVFGLYIFVSYFLHVSLPNDSSPPKDLDLAALTKYSKRYLTNWTYGVQTIYLALCCVSHLLDIIGATKINRKIVGVTDYMFTSIATPVSFVVSLVFWGIYAVDRELVYPKVLDLVMPVYINHCIHTFNSAFAIIDLMIVNHKFSSWTASLKGTFLYLTLYAVCLFGTYLESGHWLYPVLKELTWPGRLVFTLGTLVLAFLTVAITRGMHRMVWGSTSVSEKGKKNKNK